MCPKNFENTSKQGRRLRFGMLAVLTNIRSDKLRWKMRFGGRWPLGEDDLWWKMTFGGR